MSLIQEIKTWELSRINDLIKSYESKGFRASGNWADSLKSVNEITPLKLNLKIIGAAYTEFMMNGRDATPDGTTKSNPTLRSLIRKWIDDKGIRPKGDMTKDSLAFLITRKIHEEGIEPRPGAENLITDAITKEDINNLIDAIRQDQITKMIVNVKKLYNGNNSN